VQERMGDKERAERTEERKEKQNEI